MDFSGPRIRHTEEDQSDAANDLTTNLQIAVLGDFEPLEDSFESDCVLQAVRQDLSQFGIWVTDERPASPNYSMVVVTPSVNDLVNLPADGIFAEPDCNNRQRRDIVAVATAGALHEEALAGRVAQAIALSFGLDPVQRPGEIMHSAGHVDEDPVFLNECLLLEESTDSLVRVPSCSQFHTGCPDGRQNSVADLRALIFSN